MTASDSRQLEVLELLGNGHHLSQNPVACNVVDTGTELRVCWRVLLHPLVDRSCCCINLVHVVMVGQLLQGVDALLKEVLPIIEHEVGHHLHQHQIRK